ncbi:MAG: hypothetical protein SFY96_10885 [Planctomycetota bacterium]|nr:hypothetical protein [Planctomycetota bacterium]
MDFLAALWLPIVVSAAGVWVASAIGWMAIGHHNKDFKHLPDEAGFIDAIKHMSLAPGAYAFPNCADHARLKEPAIQELMKTGPVGSITLMRMPMSMGGAMIKTFVVYLAISTLVAYLGWFTLPHGGATPLTFKHGFQVLGTAGVLGYAFAALPNGIWFGQSPRAMALGVIDGIVYGLLTGAIFCWLWPK